MRSPVQGRTALDLAMPNAEYSASSARATNKAHSTNNSLKATNKCSIPFVLNDEGNSSSTYESHACENLSDSCGSTPHSVSSSSASSSPQPTKTPKHPSVLQEALHESPCHDHGTTQLLQNLSLSDTCVDKPDTSEHMTGRKISLSRPLPSSSPSDSKTEKKVEKSIIKKKLKPSPLKFKYYRNPDVMASLSSAMEAVDSHDTSGHIDGVNNSLVIRLKYKKRDTNPTTPTTHEHAISDSSPTRHQQAGKRDIMRISSILNNDPAPTVTSPPLASSNPSGAVLTDGVSPPSSPPSLDNSDHCIEYNSNDTHDHMRNRELNLIANALEFANCGLQEGHFHLLARPQRQRYEEALAEIVGDLELPFIGDRFGSQG